MTAVLKRVLIMAGGTGGHIFPGLALAHHFAAHGILVHWLGTKHGLEHRLIPQTPFKLHYIDIAGIRRTGMQALWMAPLKITYAVFQAFRVIKRVQPNVVIGMGGFVSGPGGIASYLLRYPLMIHEQNAKAGLTNQCLSYLATCVLEAFPNTFKKRSNVRTIGNPVRCALMQLPPPEERFKFKTYHQGLRLLVLGGSRGAKTLNELLPQALRRLAPDKYPQVLHQCGLEHLAHTKACYAVHGSFDETRIRLVPFIDTMEGAYAWAHLVLCRAGALTISELCAVGLGAILVPYPYAVDDHQTINANVMVKQHAAICMAEHTLSADVLAHQIEAFIRAPEKCLEMACAAYALRQISATEDAFQLCKEVCR